MDQNDGRGYGESPNPSFLDPRQTELVSAKATKRATHKANVQAKITEAQCKGSGYMDLFTTPLPTLNALNGRGHAGSTHDDGELEVPQAEHGIGWASSTPAPRSQDTKINSKCLSSLVSVVPFNDNPESDEIMYWKRGLENARNKKAVGEFERRLVVLESRMTTLEAENVKLRAIVRKNQRRDGH